MLCLGLRDLGLGRKAAMSSPHEDITRQVRITPHEFDPELPKPKSQPVLFVVSLLRTFGNGPTRCEQYDVLAAFHSLVRAEAYMDSHERGAQCHVHIVPVVP